MVAKLRSASVDGFSPDLRLWDGAAVDSLTGADWIALPALAGDPRRGARHRAIAAAAGPGAPARLPIVWELESLAWLIGVLIGGALLRFGGHPDPDPASVLLRIDPDGLPAGLALPAGTPCTARGAGGARGAIARLLGEFLGDPERRASRVLWWHGGDRVADAVLWCGDAFADRGRAARVAAALLAPGIPYSVRLGLTGDGGSRMRKTCCLSRRTAEGVECEGCPHRLRAAGPRPIARQR